MVLGSSLETACVGNWCKEMLASITHPRPSIHATTYADVCLLCMTLGTKEDGRGLPTLVCGVCCDSDLEKNFQVGANAPLQMKLYDFMLIIKGTSFLTTIEYMYVHLSMWHMY